MLIINYILLAVFFVLIKFIHSLMYIIFNAGEDGHITNVMLAISEIIQWYSIDCDIKPNKVAEK